MLPNSDVTWILQIFPKPNQMHINSNQYQWLHKVGAKFMNREQTSKILGEKLRSAYSKATSFGLWSCCRSQRSAEEAAGKQKFWRNCRFRSGDKILVAVVTRDGAAAAFAAAMHRRWEQVCKWKQRDEAIFAAPVELSRIRSLSPSFILFFNFV